MVAMGHQSAVRMHGRTLTRWQAITCWSSSHRSNNEASCLTPPPHALCCAACARVLSCTVAGGAPTPWVVELVAVVVAVFFAGAGLLPALAVPARLRDPFELLDVELVPPALELEAAVVDGGGGGGMVLRWRPLDEACFGGGGVL